VESAQKQGTHNGDYGALAQNGGLGPKPQQGTKVEPLMGVSGRRHGK